MDMSVGDQRALVARFYADFDRGDIDAAVSAFSQDLETTDPGMGTVQGIEPFREYLQTFKRPLCGSYSSPSTARSSSLATP